MRRAAQSSQLRLMTLARHRNSRYGSGLDQLAKVLDASRNGPFRGIALLLRWDASAPISLIGEPGYLVAHQSLASRRLLNLPGSMSGPDTMKSSFMRRRVSVVIAAPVSPSAPRTISAYAPRPTSCATARRARRHRA